MSHNALPIRVDALRVGMFIQLQVGWTRHPFPVSSFRITSPQQIATLRSLGLQQVGWVPSKSSPEVVQTMNQEQGEPQTHGDGDANAPMDAASSAIEQEPISEEEPQDSSASALYCCKRRYRESLGTYTDLMIQTQLEAAGPPPSAEPALQLVRQCMEDLLQTQGCALRLLPGVGGDRNAEHAVNVMVIALMVGAALGLSEAAIQDLGLAGFLHDLGKARLPQRIVQLGEVEAGQDRALYEQHVALSVELGGALGLSEAALQAIAQHHELADGSGFPHGLRGAEIGLEGQILSLANAYDRLCGAVRSAQALTPHEAVSRLYTQHKNQFDSVVLGAFVRTIGVYPPGSLVLLSNGHYGMVCAVDANYPLRPEIEVADLETATVRPLRLQTHTGIGIQRSLKPEQLPREVLDLLAPQKRFCYFFQRAVDALSDDQEPVA